MSESQDQLFAALARLINAGATAIESYSKLQEKKFEYVSNQKPDEPEKPFEQYEPGYFEAQFKKSQTTG
jgi:hypothetical protein